MAKKKSRLSSQKGRDAKGRTNKNKTKNSTQATQSTDANATQSTAAESTASTQLTTVLSGETCPTQLSHMDEVAGPSIVPNEDVSITYSPNADAQTAQVLSGGQINVRPDAENNTDTADTVCIDPAFATPTQSAENSTRNFNDFVTPRLTRRISAAEGTPLKRRRNSISRQSSDAIAGTLEVGNSPDVIASPRRSRRLSGASDIMQMPIVQTSLNNNRGTAVTIDSMDDDDELTSQRVVTPRRGQPHLSQIAGPSRIVQPFIEPGVFIANTQDSLLTQLEYDRPVNATIESMDDELASQTVDGNNEIVPSQLPPLPPVEEVIVVVAVDNENALEIERARFNEELNDLQAELIRQRNLEPNLPRCYLRAFERNAEVHYIGALERECTFCGALHFTMELTTQSLYTKCCMKGKVHADNLPPLQPFPDDLKRLFLGEHPLARHFKQKMIRYNNSFQIASINANLREFPNPGPFTYTIQGKVYYHYSNVNTTNPRPNRGPIYFLDPNEAVNQRVENQRRHNLNVALIELIENIMRTHNPYAQGYMMLREVYEQQRNNNEVPNVVLELLAVRGDRRFDLPTVNEVAAVYPINNELGPTSNFRIFVRNQPDQPNERERFQTIFHDDQRLDPMCFPLLFPRGEFGWSINLRHRNANTRVTLCQYYAYRLAIRRQNDQHPFDRFRYAGLLTQQFIVSAYARIEANNIQYIRMNQNQLRAEHYSGLIDYLHRRAVNDEVEQVGRMVILPSTFVGSPRYMQQLLQDSLCLQSKFGLPSFFITMTCNPKWPEIVENIPRNDDASNHPMLVARVFQVKLDQLLKELLEDHIFGVSVCLFYTIEFQKRGLPHAHIVLTVRAEDKPMDPLRIDLAVSAEIPNRRLEPELYALVIKHMIHSPCGVENPNAACMNEGRCRRRFPHGFCEETTINANGRVTYKRPNNGREVLIRNTHVVDNKWVAPYNRYLLLRYKAHINIDICGSNHVVKYLHKYVYKGADCGLLHLQVADNAINHDETETYVTGRYLSPPEAAQHLCKFKIHDMTHTIYRLPIHLLHRNIVHFQRDNVEAAVQANETTQLTDWFRLNTDDIQARQYRYPDIPLHYVWKRPQRRWAPRQQRAGKLLSRMYNVSIRNTELYYLRVLLLHVRGATSYEDLRTVDGTLYDTFLDACRMRMLIQDDREWHRALEEARDMHSPKQMRRFFAHIFCFAEVTNPLELWETFREFMMEDYIRRGLSNVRAEQQTLAFIQSIMMRNNKRLSDFNLPEPQERLENDVNVPVNPIEELNAGVQLRAQLNEAQSNVFDRVLAAVEDDNLQPRLFAVDGCAGSGKTFLFNTIITYLNGREIPVVPTSWTGISASLIKMGRTLHSRYKLPVPVTDTSVSGLRGNTQEGRLIRNAKLLIFDEMSMIPRLALELINRVLKDICGNDRLFGGKVILLSGDFRQTLPVMPNAYRSQIVSETIKYSFLWQAFTKLKLVINERARPEERAFSEWLLHLGNGTLPSPNFPTVQYLFTVPAQCIVPSIQQLIQVCFPNLQPGDVPHCAILTPLNQSCHLINESIVQGLAGPETTYYSADKILYENDEYVEAANYPVEVLNSYQPNGMAQHKLVLKVGVVIMLLRNMNSDVNLCNGTRLLITQLHQFSIEALRIDMTGNLTDHSVLIPRIDMTETIPSLPFKMRRRQFPVKVAYAMTINKSQGQTFTRVGIYLPYPVFTHGMMYTAFSRTRGFDSAHICIESTNSQGKLIPGSNNMFTKNIVFTEILR